MLAISRYTRNNPIAARLLGLIILCSSLITLIAIVLQLYTSFNDDISALEKRLDQVRASTLASITKSVWGFDQEQLQIQVNSVLDVADVVKVKVDWLDWNNEHQVITAAEADMTEQRVAQNPSRFLVRTYDLIYQDETTQPQSLGTLTITANLSGIYDRLWERALFIALIQGTKTLIVSILILWLVYTLLTRHMNTIAHYARQLNLDNLATPLRLKREKTDARLDELDNVTDAINHMRETLLDDLEKRRTMELELIAEKEQRLETRRQKLAAENDSRAKSQFLATMSHEIRTPMNGVIGMLEMLRDTPLDDNQQHYLDVIHRSGETLLEIINDILDYSKIEAGKMQLEMVEFDLHALAEDTVQLFGPGANKKRIELYCYIAADVPRRIQGDPTRLRQIIINLMGNAFKFTQHGCISLRLCMAEKSTQRQPKLHFEVTDTGIGIRSEVQEHLFDAFNQADSATTRNYGGTGLGLAICKSLSELMDGDIGVRSRKGEGSQFWFTAHVKPALEPLVQVVPGELAGQHLLLLEPATAMARAIEKICAQWQLEVTCVPGSSKALELIGEQSFDMALVCQQLPVMSGLEWIAQMREHSSAAKLPVVLLTGSDAPVDVDTQARLGIAKVLRKPLLPSQLLSALCTAAGLESALYEAAAPTEQAGPKAGLTHLKVLVAEDNNVNRMVIKGLLGKLGITPDIAEDGVQALQAVREAQTLYDLILMDCEMPEMDGFEATRAIRQYEREQKLPATAIVALTAHALEEHREAVFAAGMDHFLCKPITLPTLSEALDKLGHGLSEANLPRT
ncbi:response regulator [Gilvimarinus xylanilyticus]|uniref:Sensory/regulatory protein RpfC n=1 Tax=Gilvimarinus xylanilyticus TaxID=2944139 RepID=A0A9X2KU04_9GAMM|nr:response regulator [Gilvimarinus xylanilyticus]MCP8900401.1 response regulator [Gilvimarinus xylanilyticus]